MEDDANVSASVAVPGIHGGNNSEGNQSGEDRQQTLTHQLASSNTVYSYATRGVVVVRSRACPDHAEHRQSRRNDGHKESFFRVRFI